MRKLEKTSLTFFAKDWVPLTDAFLQVLSKVVQRDLAVDCLKRDLHSRRLRSGLVKRQPDGKVTITLLSASDWQRLTLLVPLRPQEGLGVLPHVDGHIYLRRADLDKHYPLAATSKSAPHGEDAQPPKTRRKPGPRVKKDWRLHVAAEAHRIFENEKRMPTAAELAQFCENELSYQPDERSIQKLIRYLIGD